MPTRKQANVDTAPPARKKKTRPGGFSRAMAGVSKAVKGQDMFGQEYQMKLEEDEIQVKSGLGTICSLILLVITAGYGYQKFGVFWDKTDVSIMQSSVDLFFTDDDQYNWKMGLNVAVAFTAYDSEKEWILDPSYGKLEIKTYSWGPRPDGSFFTERTPLESRVCSKEDLGLEGDPLKH